MVLLNMVMELCAKGWQDARIFDHVPTLYDTFIFCLSQVQLLINSLVYTMQHTASHKKYGVYHVMYSCL